MNTFIVLRIESYVLPDFAMMVRRLRHRRIGGLAPERMRPHV
jgi:hypothetical protein